MGISYHHTGVLLRCPWCLIIACIETLEWDIGETMGSHIGISCMEIAMDIHVHGVFCINK
jgi:hypothetical protein